MKGIFFDMDGVLLDSMPYHAEAMYQALKLAIDYELDKKWIYLLEGMPAEEFLLEIFKRNPSKSSINEEKINRIVSLKKKIFKEIEHVKLIDGVGELLEELAKIKCIKAVVSGSSRKEAIHIIDKMIGIENFDIIVTGDDVTKGKPDPEPYTKAIERAKVYSKDALIVENSPLGVAAASRAHMRYIITLNNTPLTIDDFYHFLPVSIKSKFKDHIFENTKSIRDFILNWIYEK
jgi:HAD superfamily hydrolase (TIGR01509 family)